MESEGKKSKDLNKIFKDEEKINFETINDRNIKESIDRVIIPLLTEKKNKIRSEINGLTKEINDLRKEIKTAEGFKRAGLFRQLKSKEDELSIKQCKEKDLETLITKMASISKNDLFAKHIEVLQKNGILK